MTQVEVLLQIAEILQSAGIPFMVAGSHGSSYYGTPRSTNDIDLVIDPSADQLENFLRLLGNQYYVSPDAARDALRRRSMFNIISFSAGEKVDLIIRKDNPFGVEQFRRRGMGKIQGTDVPFASAEDIILAKLEWDKITPSERQVRDVLEVLKVRWTELDKSYLRKWANELGVAGKLEELLGETERLQTP